MFKEWKDGEKTYYPNGLLGKGYIIPDDKLHTDLMRHHYRWSGMALLSPVAWHLFSTTGLFAFLAIFAVAFHWITGKKLSNLSVSDKKLTLRKALNIGLSTPIISRGTSIFMIISSFLFLIFGLFIVLAIAEAKFFGGGFLICGGVLLVTSIFNLKALNKKNQADA